MKALKVFLTVILAIIMFFSLSLFSGLSVFRVVTSSKFISDNITDVANSKDLDVAGLIGESSDISTEEFDKAMEELEEYISKDELSDLVGDFTSQIIRYFVGIQDDIDPDKIKDSLKDVAKKYEKKTGESLDLDEAYAEIDNTIKEVKNSVKEAKREDREALEVLRGIFGNKLYFGSLFVSIACAVLILIINKKIKPLVIALMPISIINGIGYGLAGVSSNALLKNIEDMPDVITKNLSGVFFKFMFLYIVVLILTIILLVVLDKKEKQTN